MGPHILVVEDEITLAKNISRFLCSEGCRVTAVTNLREAMRTLAEGRVDMVLLDVELPDGDGLEAFPSMRQLTPTLQGIVMTGSSRTAYRERAQQLQLSGFMIKPFPLAALGERIRALHLHPQRGCEQGDPVQVLLADRSTGCRPGESSTRPLTETRSSS